MSFVVAKRWFVFLQAPLPTAASPPFPGHNVLQRRVCVTYHARLRSEIRSSSLFPLLVRGNKTDGTEWCTKTFALVSAFLGVALELGAELTGEVVVLVAVVPVLLPLVHVLRVLLLLAPLCAKEGRGRKMITFLL